MNGGILISLVGYINGYMDVSDTALPDVWYLQPVSGEATYLSKLQISWVNESFKTPLPWTISRILPIYPQFVSCVGKTKWLASRISFSISMVWYDTSWWLISTAGLRRDHLSMKVANIFVTELFLKPFTMDNPEKWIILSLERIFKSKLKFQLKIADNTLIYFLLNLWNGCLHTITTQWWDHKLAAPSCIDMFDISHTNKWMTTWKALCG